MNKNKFIPAKSSKLTDSQRVTIFNAFDAAAEIINKKTSYIRRFSEPRKNGLGYRCKFWGVKIKGIDPYKLVAKIEKALPDGYTAELSRGSWSYDIIIRTPKLAWIVEGTDTADSTTVDPFSGRYDMSAKATDTAYDGENTIVKTWSNVDFQAPMCPPMTVTVYCEIEVDPAGKVVSKEATDLQFACADMPEAKSEELSGTMAMMGGLLGVEGIKDAIVDAGKKGLELCVEEVVALHKQGEFTSMQDEDTVKPTKGADRMHEIKNDIIERQAAEIAALKAKIAELHDECGKMEADFSELTSEHENLQELVETITSEVENLDITEFLIEGLNHMDHTEYVKLALGSNGTITASLDVDMLAADIAYNVNDDIARSFSSI